MPSLQHVINPHNMQKQTQTLILFKTLLVHTHCVVQMVRLHLFYNINWLIKFLQFITNENMNVNQNLINLINVLIKHKNEYAFVEDNETIIINQVF